MEYANRKLRHELKYFINNFEYSILSGRLKHVLTKDIHSNENCEYNIRSLYFDNIYSNGLFEKQSGVENRLKFRIRIYDKSDSVIKLEKKSKLGQFTCKETTLISKDAAESILAGNIDSISDSKNALLRNFYCETRTNLLCPTVIVEYDREAYFHPAGDVRVTFDKYLRTGLGSTDLFNGSIPTISALDEPVMIMEIKYDQFFPDYIKDILHIPIRQRVSVSKYTACRKFNKMNEWEDN